MPSDERRPNHEPGSTTMTIAELIEILQEAAENSANGDETEVRLMTQENWPFENEIHGACLASEMVDLDEGIDDEADDFEPEDEVFYLVEGRQLGYGNKNAWAAARGM